MRKLFCLLVLSVFYLGQINLNGAANAQGAPERALLSAAAAGNAIRVKQLLETGASIDARDPAGRTALLLATHANHVETAQLLIKAGADVNAKDHLQDSPYLYAGAEGRLEILKLTVKAGADLNSTNRYGGTALTPAAHHGHIETVRFLVTTKVPINQINNLGWTALLETVILGDGGPTYQAIADILIKAGADVNIADAQGKSPLTHARQRGFKEIAQALAAAGAK